VYQVLRRKAEAKWADISEQTLLRELRREGCANPYAIAARLKTGDPLVTRLARYRWTGEIVPRRMTKRAIANSAHTVYGT
jgi:phosphohistidine phosphatase SixA